MFIQSYTHSEVFFSFLIELANQPFAISVFIHWKDGVIVYNYSGAHLKSTKVQRTYVRKLYVCPCTLQRLLLTNFFHTKKNLQSILIFSVWAKLSTKVVFTMGNDEENKKAKPAG